MNLEFYPPGNYQSSMRVMKLLGHVRSQKFTSTGLIVLKTLLSFDFTVLLLGIYQSPTKLENTVGLFIKINDSPGEKTSTDF